MKKIIFHILLLLTLLAIIVFLFNFQREKYSLKYEKEEDSPRIEEFYGDEEENNLVIAVCPTFHYMADELKNEKEINIIKTGSTMESLILIESGAVDVIISGRALKKEEPNLLFEIIGDGYDFIFKEEILIYEKEMQSISFYTDLSLEKIIEDFDFITEQNLFKTENINDALEKGIVITFLKDKIIGEIVHIYGENEERLLLSRLPRLYYFPDFKKEKINFIKEIIKEN